MSTIKIQIISDYQEYKQGQIVELDEKTAINLLTNGKALKIHRKKNDVPVEKTEERTEEKPEENSEEKNSDKENKKSKKNDQ